MVFFDKTAVAFSKLAIFSFSLYIVLFRDSTFPLTNVRSSFLVEHFESFIRDIVESPVSRCAPAKASSEASRLSSFPRSDGVKAAWFLFGFGVKQQRTSAVFFSLGMSGGPLFRRCGSFRK